MLDLISADSKGINTTYLEPDCENGNIIVVILALSSIYGVDILEDNVEDCRNRLFDEWNLSYTKQCGIEWQPIPAAKPRNTS